MVKKSILLIAGTHGDEKIGEQVIKRLKRKNYSRYFDYLIANPRASKKNRRFIEKDLNRSYPGSPRAKAYESRLAYRNLRIARRYRYIIDLHEAREGNRDFIIVPRKNISPRFPLAFINLRTVLLWPNPRGPLSQVLPQSIELEFGMKNRQRPVVIAKATRVVSRFINKIKENKTVPTAAKKYFLVYDSLRYKNLPKIIPLLIDFHKAQIKKEVFYPLLVNQYCDLGIVCYKMKKMRRPLFRNRRFNSYVGYHYRSFPVFILEF